MLNFLRDSAWQGIAGITAVIALLLYVYVERDKLFRGLNQRTQFTLNFAIAVAVLVLFAIGAALSAALSIGATAITLTLTTYLNKPIGVLLASSLLGAGLASFFSILHFILFRDYVKNIASYMLVVFVGIVLLGIWTGILNTQISESSFLVARITFEWGRGVFLGMDVVTIALLIDKLSTQKK